MKIKEGGGGGYDDDDDDDDKLYIAVAMSDAYAFALNKDVLLPNYSFLTGVSILEALCRALFENHMCRSK
jgi:hypothetical protein